MTTIYSGLIPQGVQVIYEYNPEFTYIINPAKTLCFPVMIKTTWLQIVVELSDITPFQNCFVPVLRAWPSKDINGVSLLNAPRSVQSTVNLLPTGVSYNFYLIDSVSDEDRIPADLYCPVFGNTQYWMNIQNLQNKTSNLYCKFTSYSKKLTYTY
jgi:hypothetical protein